MKKIFILLLILRVYQPLIGEEIQKISFIIDFAPSTWGVINDENLSIEYFNSSTEPRSKINFPIQRDEKSGLLFINFAVSTNLFPLDEQLIESILPGNKKWLVLYYSIGNYVSIHEDDNNEPIYRYGLDYIERSRSVSYTATSHLTENGVEYSPENLKDIRTGRPWVEGVPGDGVGERIYLTYDRYPNEGFSHLLLSNGFVSYRNPSLYGKNGRLKRIRVIDRESDFVQEFGIEDTPNYQILELNRPLKNIIIEIREVYPGSRWDDTCVNLLEPVWPQL